MKRTGKKRDEGGLLEESCLEMVVFFLQVVGVVIMFDVTCVKLL